MAEPEVWVFFYGSFINREVLAQVEYAPRDVEVARLHGYDISIAPLATLVPADGRTVYGILALATHAELGRLYTQEWVGDYLPHPVAVERLDGSLRPALCYIKPRQAPHPPANDYLDRIVGPARELGFPDWYLERLESFRP